MKLIVSIVTILLFVCNTIAQQFNASITERATTSLQGKINKEALMASPYDTWFTKNYMAYQPDKTSIEKLKPVLKKYTVKAFMGTWCGDSKREVPKLYSILEAADFPINRLTLIGVSKQREHYKQSPGGEEEGLHIARVPTFIIYKDGVEVQRFVEKPIKTLEEDLVKIIEGTYTSSYQIIASTGNLILEMGSKKFERNLKRIAKKLRPLANHHKELTGYSSVLYYANKKKEALAVAKLNTLLFPEEVKTYLAYGSKLIMENKLELAKKEFRHALKLDPRNENAQKNTKIAMFKNLRNALQHMQPLQNTSKHILKRANKLF